MLLSCLCLLACLFPGTAALAQSKPPGKGNGETAFQGVIVLVDRTNTKDITFSLLDRTGKSNTFHITAKTHFAAHQSVDQLVPNLAAKVSGVPNSSGDWNATQVQFQHNTASLTLQGVVTAINPDQTINLALNDGTVVVIHLPASTMKSLSIGMQLTVQAKFDSSNRVQGQQVKVQAQHSSHYQVRGVINHISTRTHRFSVLTPQGNAFSILQTGTQKSKTTHAVTLHVGEKVTVSGTIDSQGNLDEQQITVNADQTQQIELCGMVTTIDTTANTFSLVDEDGNVTVINASASLLASIQVGNIYQFTVTVASDGTFTAVSVDSSQGSDQGEPLEINGVVQSYDASSGSLSMSGESGDTFSIQVTDQTIIKGDDGASSTLQQGQAIEVKAQANTDGTYTALKIEIQDNASQGDSMTFVGVFQSYDSSSGQLTLALESSTITVATTAQTQIKGIDSLSSIPAGSRVKVRVQVQQDGSYQALVVEVKKAKNGGDGGGNGGDNGGGDKGGNGGGNGNGGDNGGGDKGGNGGNGGGNNGGGNGDGNGDGNGGGHQGGGNGGDNGGGNGGGHQGGGNGDGNGGNKGGDNGGGDKGGNGGNGGGHHGK